MATRLIDKKALRIFNALLETNCEAYEDYRDAYSAYGYGQINENKLNRIAQKALAKMARSRGAAYRILKAYPRIEYVTTNVRAQQRLDEVFDHECYITEFLSGCKVVF